MNNPKDMLVSDERLRELRDESENMIVFGREVRAIYEAELTKLRSERDELVGALIDEYERLESKCNEDDARGRDSYWVRHYRDFQKFLLAQISKHKPE